MLPKVSCCRMDFIIIGIFCMEKKQKSRVGRDVCVSKVGNGTGQNKMRIVKAMPCLQSSWEGMMGFVASK